MISFAMQNIFSLFKVSFIFVFITFALGDTATKKNCYDLSYSVMPKISRRFMVSSFIFRSLIHFEVMFVNGVRKYSKYFILLHVAVCFQSTTY